jgi:predicted PurR-regulated permease PerM
VGIFSTAFIAFFFLKEEGMFREGLMALTPEGYEDRFSRSFDRITNLLNRYFIGLVIEIIIVAILVTIGLLIVGLNFGTAALIGVLCGLFNVIPYLGPWIGGGFGIVIALAMNVDQPFMSHTLPVLGFMIIVFGSSQMIDNILISALYLFIVVLKLSSRVFFGDYGCRKYCGYSWYDSRHSGIHNFKGIGFRVPFEH